MALDFFQKGDKVRQQQVKTDILSALSHSQAMIEFSPDGTILSANKNFCQAMGYEIDEIVGQHHRIFVDSTYAASPEYKTFWKQLAEGEFQIQTFKRFSKSGAEIWIEASYNPLVDADGKVYRVVKLARDVTAQQRQTMDQRGQIEAISRSQAVIEFELDGTIITANPNFCQAMGYDLEEIKGQHHRLFVRAEDVADPSYAEFWRKLGRGEFQAAEYLRLGKGGKAVWIQASYNPIFDADGRPYKVVKYATDITARKEAVATLGQSLSLLAEGDLRCQIDAQFPADLEPVRVAFNQSVDRFADIVRDLKDTSKELRGATVEILAGANDLSDRTTRQAAAIEETTAAVEEFSNTVTENAKRADAVRDSARSLSSRAAEAGEVMSQANTAMEDVTTQAAKISNIIGMIDDIAFQTNLLALNASVEAARAGDAGKGFAVVAIEVRRLAQSAASASGDVKALIEQSNTAVGSGSSLVSAATEHLTKMVSQVQENLQLMDQIAQANSDQRTAIAEVSTTMRQMDEMTQHNAALVEETNAAIEQTEGQAGRLDSLVEIFVVDEGAKGASASTAAISRAPRPVAEALAPKPYLSEGAAAVAVEWEEF